MSGGSQSQAGGSGRPPLLSILEQGSECGFGDSVRTRRRGGTGGRGQSGDPRRSLRARVRARPDPSVHRGPPPPRRPAPPPAPAPSFRPSFPPSLPRPGGGDAAAARSSRGSLSLTGEPGGGGRHLPRQSLAGPSLRRGKSGRASGQRGASLPAPVASGSAMSWGTELWVSEASGEARAVGGGGGSPGWWRRGGPAPLCARESPPAPHLGGEAAARAPAEWGLAVALDGRRRPLARLRLTWRTGGRAGARSRSAPLYPAPDGGGGDHCPEGAPLALPAPRAGATPQLQVGGAGRLCSEGARPRASQAQPTRPFPSPSRCLRARDPQGARHSAPASAGCSLFGLTARAFFVCVTGIR